MDTENVLRRLDKHALEFNFPVFNNAYVEYAAARLTAFRGSGQWLIAFEVLGFSTREGTFVNDLYGYGSCLEKEGIIAANSVLSPTQAYPLFDPETTACIASWSAWEVQLDGQTISFSPSRAEYRDAKIEVPVEPGPGSLKEIQLLRFALAKLGARKLFMRDQEILSHFPNCPATLPVLIQTIEWQHPDVAGREKPSENVSIRSLLDAIKTGDPARFQRGHPNTGWQYWQSRSVSA